MIDRYTRPEMGRIWTLENRYRAWLAVEVAVCEAWSDMGRIPAEAVEVIRKKADIDVDRILAIEEVTRHDVIAFLTSLEEKVGPEARYIHLGCTSSDIVDTANGLLFKQAGALLLDDVRGLLESLQKEEVYGFSRLYTQEEARKEERFVGPFSFVLETDGYTAFGDFVTRPLVSRLDNEDYRFGQATHGYLPRFGPQPILLAKGPSIRENVVLSGNHIVNEAPTYAKILGADLGDTDGKPIEEILKA